MSTAPATLAAPIEQADIRRLIPHADNMCLLDRVLRWTDTDIECTAIGHCALDHPLRHDGILSIHTGIEYCAQAIAVHGSLTNKERGPPRRGFLAVILNTQWHVQRLDDCIGALQITAQKLVVLQQGVNYTFAINHEGHALLTGQAVVALE
jgi:predicted hotdog family 3-hydroxylacyl-ACP dehydratase